MRRTLLIVTLLFILGLGAATVDDITMDGITPVSVVSIMILVFFSITIVGALRTPPRE